MKKQIQKNDPNQQRNSRKLRSFGAVCEGIHAKLARNPGTRNFVGFATVVVIACVVFTFAAPQKGNNGKPHTFSSKEELTTTRDVVLTTTREVWDSYPPEYGISKGKANISVPRDIYEYDNSARGESPIMERAGRKMVSKGTYNLGTVTYPAGSKVRILSTDTTGKWNIVLMGPSKEQFELPNEAILEAGGTPGDPVNTASRQPPKIVSTVNWDGPEGIWTGLATGDENIPSSDPTWEKKFFDLVNHERTSRGIPALVWNEDMARAARYHAADCYVQFYRGHDTQDSIVTNPGPTPAQFRVETFAYRAKKFSRLIRGGNAGGGPSLWTPEKSLKNFMDSPGHRENILRKDAHFSGVGYIRGYKDMCIVQDFGS